MPFTAAICSIPVISVMLAVPAAGIVIVTAPNSSQDICAVLGALIASILTLVEARKRDRSIGHTLSVFLGTASVGSFLPGIAVQTAVLREWLEAETATVLSWQSWAFAGLICGMNAWWILHGINRVIQRRAEKYFSDDL